MDAYQHVKPEDLRAPLAEMGGSCQQMLAKQTNPKEEEGYVLERMGDGAEGES